MALRRIAVVTVAVLSVFVAGCGGGKRKAEEASIGVNSFLWRASLDVLEYMPLASADPYGGVVLTDWYATPEAPNERFKTTVYILDSRLRADGLKVAINKQVRDAAGGWTDAVADEDAAILIENAILTRARELKIATIGN